MSITAQANPDELRQFNVRLPRRMLARIEHLAYVHRLDKKEVVVAALNAYLPKLANRAVSERPVNRKTRKGQTHDRLVDN